MFYEAAGAKAAETTRETPPGPGVGEQGWMQLPGGLGVLLPAISPCFAHGINKQWVLSRCSS